MKKSIWFFILLCISPAAVAQYQDAGLWAGLMLRFEPGKKWKIGLEEEARFFENMSRLDKINSEISIDYQISKFLDAGILYRLISRPKNGNRFDFNHRFGAYLNVQKKYGGWNGSLKATFQKSFSEFRHSDDWYVPENYVRGVAEVSRELKNKKTEPYTNIEFWYRVSAGEPAFVDQYRLAIGIKQKLNKRNRLDVFYKLQQELQVKNPSTSHIFGIGYRYIFR